MVGAVQICTHACGLSPVKSHVPPRKSMPKGPLSFSEKSADTGWWLCRRARGSASTALSTR
eukprot:4379838-Amphidinium_carterae.1